MELYGALWSPMNIYEPLWSPMEPSAALWIPIDLYGALCSPMEPHGTSKTGPTAKNDRRANSPGRDEFVRRLARPVPRLPRLNASPHSRPVPAHQRPNVTNN